MVHCIINVSRLHSTIHDCARCHVNSNLYSNIFVTNCAPIRTFCKAQARAKEQAMTEFVPLGERIEMEEVLSEPTADRVRNA